MNTEQVKSAVRWLITTFGPFIIAHGWASASMLETVGGIVVSIVPFLWSMTVHTQSNAVAVVSEIAKLPDSPVRAVITEATPAGRDLAQSIPGPTVVAAGTTQAADIAAR